MPKNSGTAPAAPSVNWEGLSVADAIAKLETTEHGLAKAEALARLQRHGPNELPQKKRSNILIFLSFIWNPLSWTMETVAIVSIILRDFPDFVLVFALLIVNACIGFYEEHSAGNAVAALMSSVAPRARVMRDGELETIPAREVVLGDMVHLRLGDIVPADCKLVSSGGEVKSDESALTGESFPAAKNVGDVMYSGSTIKHGECDAIVYATGRQSFIGRSASLVSDTSQEGHIQKVLTRVGQFCLSIIVVWVALELAIQFGARGQPCSLSGAGECPTLSNALVILIGGVPIAMPTVLSVTMAIGAMQLAKKRAIVTRLSAVEELAGMDVLCSDKTGTLTLNELSVSKPDLYVTRGHTTDELLMYGALSTKAEDGDAIDVCMANAVPNGAELWQTYERTGFLPFDHVTKRTVSTLKNKTTGESFRVAKGAPQVILQRDSRRAEIETEVTRQITALAMRGLRAIGVAISHDPPDTVPSPNASWELVGLVALVDPPRPDSAETIAKARELGIAVKMITGDQIAIAVETARQLGMKAERMYKASIFNVQTGEGLERQVSARQYGAGGEGEGHVAVRVSGNIDVDEIVENADGFAEVFPEHKYDIVARLQNHKHMVGMTGDGVNDAPALKRADIGVAVAGATDAARAAADIVLMAPGLAVIIHAIVGSRKIFQRMRNYAMYSVSMTVRVAFTFGLLTVIFDWYFTTFIMVILAILNDGCMLSISRDRCQPSPAPDSWRLFDIFVAAVVIGLYLTLSTVVLFILVRETAVFNEAFGLASFEYLDVNPTCFSNHWTPEQASTVRGVESVSTIIYAYDNANDYTLGAFDSPIACVAAPAPGVRVTPTFSSAFGTTLPLVSFVAPSSSEALGCYDLTTCQFYCVCAQQLRRSERTRGLIYLTVSITGLATIFFTRTRGFFFSYRPSYAVLAAFAISQLAATFIAVYGFNGYPTGRDGFRGCGWGYALVAWVWSILWLLPMDFIKFGAFALIAAWDRMRRRRRGAKGKDVPVTTGSATDGSTTTSVK